MEIKNVIGKYRSSGREWYKRNVNTITKITVHHTASPQKPNESHDSILKKHTTTHVNKGWPGLSYHFMIMPDGAIYQINDFNEVTWHDGKNYESLGVCIEGYFHPDKNEKPNDKQLASLKFLLDELCTKHPEFPADFNDVRGHRETMQTACPGNFLFPYVQEYREKTGNVNWGGAIIEPPMTLNDYFKFDVTKKMPIEVFNGLSFNKTKLPATTALDEIHGYIKNLEDDNKLLQKNGYANGKNDTLKQIANELGKTDDNVSFADFVKQNEMNALSDFEVGIGMQIAETLGFEYDVNKNIETQVLEWKQKNPVNNKPITIADVLLRLFNKLKDIKI